MCSHAADGAWMTPSMRSLLRLHRALGWALARGSLQGLWPAFWMMPQDNVYGEWAASGEIDILESRNNLTEVSNNLNFGELADRWEWRREEGNGAGRGGGIRSTAGARV